MRSGHWLASRLTVFHVFGSSVTGTSKSTTTQTQDQPLQAGTNASHEEVTYYYDNVYRCLSTLNKYGTRSGIKEFDLSKVTDGKPEILPRLLTDDFEQLRTIRDYRTPRYFHQASVIIFYLMVVFLSPYWLHFCPNVKSSCPAAYFNSISFTVVVSALFQVHDALENPFDMEGLDDICLATTAELRRLHGEAGEPFEWDRDRGRFLIEEHTRFYEEEGDTGGLLRAPDECWADQ